MNKRTVGVPLSPEFLDQFGFGCWICAEDHFKGFHEASDAQQVALLGVSKSAVIRRKIYLLFPEDVSDLIQAWDLNLGLVFLLLLQLRLVALRLKVEQLIERLFALSLLQALVRVHQGLGLFFEF